MKALARRTDPATSHAAARAVERKGKAHSQREACLEAVRQHPGKTAYEIAAILGIEGIVPGKRLPELRDQAKLIKDGPARICAVRKSKAMTWWMAELEEMKQEEIPWATPQA